MMAACIRTLSPIARSLVSLRGAGLLLVCLFGGIAATPARAVTLTSLEVATPVPGGTASNGLVTLSANAPAGGVTVNLSSSNSTYASVPSSVLVPAGVKTASFLITTSSVTSQKTVTITATYAGIPRNATLTIMITPNRPRLTDFSEAPMLRFDWGGATLSGLSYYSWTLTTPSGNVGNTTYSPTVTLTSPTITSLTLGFSYTFAVSLNLWSYSPSTHSWNLATYPLNPSVQSTPQKLVVQDNQAVDARYDLRYSVYTFLNHNFGATVYRGGLFVGNSPDPSRMGRSFLRFPTLTIPAGTTLWCASTNAYFNGALVTNTSGWSVKCIPVPDTGWTVNTLTWATAPAMDPTDPNIGPAMVTYNTSSPTTYWVHWGGIRLTGLLAAGIGPCLGLAVSTEAADQTNGINSWLYFVKKEYDSSKAAYLLYATGNAPLSEVYIIFNDSTLHLSGSPHSTTATVYLNGKAPAGGTVVALSSGNPSIATVSPSAITIPEGQASGTFTVTAGTTAGSTSITAGITISGAADSWTITVVP